MEYFADHVEINPLNTFLKLNTISNPPFAVYFRNKIITCFSPERYLKKIGKSSSRNLSKVPQNDTPTV
jgi:para-aminobenzoate synthetase component 1